MDPALLKIIKSDAYQSPAELNWLENFLKQQAPKRILEIGVAKGGLSALFLSLVGEDGIVVGLDLSDDLVHPNLLKFSNYHFLLGNSGDEATRDRVATLCSEFDVVFIDGDHTLEGVLRDTELYIPLLRDGGWAFWHDVRADHPVGIKPTWYNKIKRSHPGAFEVYAAKDGAGIGAWKKTQASFEQLEKRLNQNLEQSYRKFTQDLDALDRLLSCDPYRRSLWESKVAAENMAGNRKKAVLAKLAICILGGDDISSHLSDLLADPLVERSPDLARSVAILKKIQSEKIESSEKFYIALAASRCKLHLIAEDKIDECYSEGLRSAEFLVERVRILFDADVPLPKVVDAVCDLIQNSIDASEGKEPEKVDGACRHFLNRAMVSCFRQQQPTTFFACVDAVKVFRPDLIPELALIISKWANTIADIGNGITRVRVFEGPLDDLHQFPGANFDADGSEVVSRTLQRLRDAA